MADYRMPPQRPVLQQPPGFPGPNVPAQPPAAFARPVPRKVALPVSISPQKKSRSCCRTSCCYCCFLLLILIILIVVFGLVFFFWFNPKLPLFRIESFKILDFNVTLTPNGKYLDAQTVTQIEFRNPNEKITLYYGTMEVDVSVGKGSDETDLGTASLPEFTQRSMNKTSLKVETKVKNQKLYGGTGERPQARLRSKNLVVNMEVQTKVGVGLSRMKLGMLGVAVKCSGTMKELDGGTMPKCTITLLKWITVHV
ncbi:hypothetical protein SLEP1_g9929 [Rubroshorea leprosula]|uniref:Late embryogenesis abundant protein LEA-2 subgroup domain-containing protein n=1 Tax=Rubroshorea leprosula TaxID=152421 RepID=A0AAV5ICE1_9ROSI|nr:hypothetical protein SLEP1_g9929 [Rubroshorea leprosula]